MMPPTAGHPVPSEAPASPGESVLLRKRLERLQAVVEASELVNSTLEVPEIARRVVETATSLIGAERGSLFLVDEDGETLRALVAHGVDAKTLTVRRGEGIVGTVAAEGVPLLLDDPYADPRFDPAVDRRTGFRTRSLLTVPVRDRERRLVAVLQLLNHHRGHFDSEDVEFLEELGVPFALALTTARLHREIVRRERMEEELRLAGEIQRTLRPRHMGEVPGLELASWDVPCREVGGDYYDLVPARGGLRWWLVMADISGKGVSAGLIASNLQAYLWSRRDDRRPLRKIVAGSNDLLCRLARGHKFATLILAQWNPASGSLRWVGAGHPPMLLLRDGAIRRLESTGPPVGLIPHARWDEGGVELRPGDVVLMYTDGVLEAGMERLGEEFGQERLEAAVRGAASCGEVLRRIREALEAFQGPAGFEDDVTVLCCGVETSRPAPETGRPGGEGERP